MKFIAYIFFALSLSTIAIWFVHNADYGETNYFTKHQKQVITIEKDELFGTENEIYTYEDGFWLGLFPADDQFGIDMFIGVVPIVGISSILGLVLVFVDKKNKGKQR